MLPHQELAILVLDTSQPYHSQRASAWSHWHCPLQPCTCVTVSTRRHITCRISSAHFVIFLTSPSEPLRGRIGIKENIAKASQGCSRAEEKYKVCLHRSPSDMTLLLLTPSKHRKNQDQIDILYHHTSYPDLVTLNITSPRCTSSTRLFPLRPSRPSCLLV
jgi:hypothetical protein